MHEQDRRISEELLRQWHYRREIVNYYAGALLRLSPYDHNASQRWRELNEKLAIALIALRGASDQLQSFEQEQSRKG